ncbi:hypothetical protein NBT05_11690 [Aquimarina sp. ERC-38]|uniref:hypothetical protein n=1 Tax=Aquimarina sp. ERC-38 TaxID=2949996 RepID=UPI0022484C99|nr:hypothetical protein [Aquimarina sp. ERC-38]UZO79615.1 hypothetical protein NBT05_11690 [Aquimarina sp. ERC-38]
MNTKTIKITTISLSIGLLIIALTQKCYCTTSLCGDSIVVFIFGAIGIFFGGATLCWLANPLLILSWLLINQNKVSLLLSLASFLIASSFLLFDEIIDDEAGHYRKIIGYELGFWLWLSSNGVTLLGNMLIKKKGNIA